jgi:hypothetical protein
LAGGVTVLLAKPSGGHRGITILPGLYRVWARARAEASREWEEDHRDRRLEWQARKGSAPAVIRQGLRAEAAAGAAGRGGRDAAVAATVLMDLQSFYDFVAHRQLYDEARRTRFPLDIVRLAVSMYRGPRVLHYGSHGARVDGITRGIAAGCSFATTLVQVLYARALRRWAARHPKVEAAVYIDDLAVQSVGREETVARRLGEAVAELGQVVAEELQCRVAPAKTQVIASSRRLRRKLTVSVGRALRGRAGGAPLAKNLGVLDGAGGARGGLPLRRGEAARLQAARRRAARIRRLRPAIGGKKAVRMTQAVVGGALRYGAELYGWAPGRVREYEQFLVKAVARGTAGSRTAKLAAMGDDTWRGALAPVMGLANFVWTAAHARRDEEAGAQLRDYIAQWRVVMRRPPASWRQVRGPVGAAAMAAREYLGWTFGEPFELQTPEGGRVGFLSHSPAGVEWFIRSGWRRRRAEQLARAMGAAGGQLSAEAGARAARSKDLDKHEAAAAFAFISQNVWPAGRLRRAGYVVEDSACPRCGRAEDELEHRLWECEATAAAREEHFTPAERKRLEEAPRPWAAKGLVELEDVGAAGSFASVGRCALAAVDEQEAWARANVYFIDGSAQPSAHPGARRAAWSVVAARRPEQDAPEGQLLAAAFGPVGADLPQTSGAAELAALAAAAQFARASVTVYTDYATTVRAAADPDWQTGRRRKLGGIVRAAKSEAGWKYLTVVKVKAHQQVDNLRGAERFEARGNDAADRFAKQGLALHPPMQEQRRRAAEQDSALAAKVVRYAGKVLALWPAAEARGRHRRSAGAAATRRAGGGEEPRRQEATEEADGRQHQWQWRNRHWQCERCLRWTASASKVHARATGQQACPGRVAELQRLVGDPAGHSLVAFDLARGGGWLLACSRCGGYAATPAAFAAMAGRRCGGVRNRGAEARWRRLLAGKHPAKEAAVGAGAPLRV